MASSWSSSACFEALDSIVPGGVVVRGLRCDERELAKLFPEEAAALVRATSRDDDDPSVPEIVHGRCGEGARRTSGCRPTSTARCGRAPRA